MRCDRVRPWEHLDCMQKLRWRFHNQWVISSAKGHGLAILVLIVFCNLFVMEAGTGWYDAETHKCDCMITETQCHARSGVWSQRLNRHEPSQVKCNKEYSWGYFNGQSHAWRRVRTCLWCYGEQELDSWVLVLLPCYCLQKLCARSLSRVDAGQLALCIDWEALWKYLWAKNETCCLEALRKVSRWPKPCESLTSCGFAACWKRQRFGKNHQGVEPGRSLTLKPQQVTRVVDLNRYDEQPQLQSWLRRCQSPGWVASEILAFHLYRFWSWFQQSWVEGARVMGESTHSFGTFWTKIVGTQIVMKDWRLPIPCCWKRRCHCDTYEGACVLDFPDARGRINASNVRRTHRIGRSRWKKNMIIWWSLLWSSLSPFPSF